MKRPDNGRPIPSFHELVNAYSNSPECSETPSEACFRKDHFHRCTVHKRMTDDNGVCSQSPPSSAPDNVMRCTKVQADKTEEESYWAEVEENAATGGAGFR